MKKSILFLFVGILVSMQAYSQQVIELIYAESIEFDADLIDAERVIGNVKFKQDSVYMVCDSAYFFRKQNRLTAFNNIRIYRKDSFSIKGQYLEYDGDDRKALVREGVVMTDRKMTLTTSEVRYDFKSKQANYPNPGTIRDEKNTLSSKRGIYNSALQQFYFIENVNLVNEDYTITGEKLNYNTATKLAEFSGHTIIKSDQQQITCKKGWYNTQSKLSSFSQGVTLQDTAMSLSTDSLYFDDNTRIGVAKGNIVLHDSVNNYTVIGQYGFARLNDHWHQVHTGARALMLEDEDSLVILADTLTNFGEGDSNTLLAYPKVQVFRSEMTGLADSLSYTSHDSTTALYYTPIVWFNEDQITGDTISFVRRSQGASQAHVKGKGFIASPIQTDYYNQISGNSLIMDLNKSGIKRVHVNGNGSALYYLEEDSQGYVGANYVISPKFIIEFEDDKVSKVRFNKSSEGNIFPVNNVPGDKQQLPNFIWHSELKPLKPSQFYEGIAPKFKF